MTKHFCRFILFATLFLRQRQLHAAPLDPSRAESYLTQYGHLIPAPTNSPTEEVRYTESSFREAIISFQQLAGLNLTGELDADTLEMMGKDRCSVPDNVGHSSYVRRKRRIRKRYVAQGSRWPTTRLLYFFQNTTKNLNAVLNKEIVRTAFNLWSSASTLVASETFSSTSANIKLLYAARSHGDAWPFDGKGGVLAHAFFPDSGGDAHFDDDESWTDGINSGTNLLQVTTHELGHSLGLGHSSESGAVMAPFYNGYNPSFRLSQDDINGIRYLYGSPGDPASPSTTPPLPTPTPTLPTSRSSLQTLSTFQSSSSTTTQNPQVTQFCANGNVDAIVSIGTMTYAFQGDMYAVLSMNGIESGYPRYIRQEWPDLPDSLDAVLYLDPIFDEESGGNEPAYLFFYKGGMYWRYSNTFHLDSGYPRLIKEGFPGIPDNLDASFIWSGNGKVYFIKGDEYYRYTRWRGADSTYPRTLAVWRGLPQQIDAAFQWTNGRTYFFSGTEFYRFDDVRFYTDDDYPKPIASSWFGCPGSESAPVENLRMEQQQAQDQFYDVTLDGPLADPPSSRSSTSEPYNLERPIHLSDDHVRSGTGSHSLVSRIHLGLILLTHSTLSYLITKS